MRVGVDGFGGGCGLGDSGCGLGVGGCSRVEGEGLRLLGLRRGLDRHWGLRCHGSGSEALARRWDLQRLLDVRGLRRLLRGQIYSGGNEEGGEEERDFAPDPDLRVLECIAESVPAANVRHQRDGGSIVFEQAGESVYCFCAGFPCTHCGREEGEEGTEGREG